MRLLHLQNMKLAIFDFDGTIADTSEGIIDAHKFTLNSLHHSIPSDEDLHLLIGGNLLKIYIETFGFNELYARKAIQIYRNRYSEVGIHKASLYPGFADMLIKLKEAEFKIGVATLKAEKFAKIMLEEMHINHLFDQVCGMDPNDGLDKAGLILKCIDLCGCDRTESVLIGDSENDRIGASQAKVDFIGVTYGFGFKPDLDYDFVTANTPDSISLILTDNI